MPSAATWLDLEIIISEVKSERGRKIPYDITYIQNLKYDTNQHTYKTKRLTDIDRRLVVAKGGCGVEEGKMGTWN